MTFVDTFYKSRQTNRVKNNKYVHVLGDIHV